MKKTLLTLALVGASAAAFAQGKVALAWDIAVTFPGALQMLAPDIGLAGQAVPTTGPLPSGIVLYVGLYAGTSSTSLSLVSGENINPVGGTGLPAGAFNRLNMLLPFAGGSFDFFQVKIWDSAYASYEAQATAGRVGTGLDYAAQNNIFSMVPGTGIAYPQVYNGGSTTWTAVGNENVSALMPVTQPVPEPTILALAGLGGAALLIFRRRK